jgi:hypothetical protein
MGGAVCLLFMSAGENSPDEIPIRYWMGGYEALDWGFVVYGVLWAVML